MVKEIQIIHPEISLRAESCGSLGVLFPEMRAALPHPWPGFSADPCWFPCSSRFSKQVLVALSLVVDELSHTQQSMASPGAPLAHLRLITSVTFINTAHSCQGSFPSHHPRQHAAALLCRLDLGKSKPPPPMQRWVRAALSPSSTENCSFHQVKHWLNL